MTDNVIELEHVGKRYRLGEHSGSGSDLRESVTRLANRIRRRPGTEPRELWSLRDVSFSVGHGEALGIIGPNGAGKSTLLKIISNITTPTTGRSRTLGRIGSLLEVGTGFHGELTGLENTYLNGAILGMTRREVAGKIDDIVDFAGMAKFMDTPVKRYSSGMYLRLGFSIAAHMEADILLVDEVLAVGDADFQRKCLGRMSEVEQSGRTVLFVSHNMDAMVRLCPRTIRLENGSIVAEGSTHQIVRDYLRSTAVESAAITFEDDQGLRAHIRTVSMSSGGSAASTRFSSGDSAIVEMAVTVNEPVPGLDLVCILSNAMGAVLLEEHMSDGPSQTISAPGRYTVRCTIPPVL
ncbi:MAG TPA: polysaccharide ABC transporter ATP-binding protein, partial [Ilumatobacteraceae bacterium]|nr:polysaccharide ABC transporter ATP-binding protein [Ilumatobacteraceae bacterium]